MNGLESRRFYPASVPPFAFEPDRDHFEIRPISDDCGEGVVARKRFRAGEIVFAFTGYYMSEVTLFTLQVRPGVYLHDPFFMGKILHRCDPNCDVDMERRVFTARRDIEPGEWVTMNYEQTEDRLFRPFTCNCGDEPCEGFVRNRVIRGRAVNGVLQPVLAPEPVFGGEPAIARQAAMRMKLAAAGKRAAHPKRVARRRAEPVAAK